MRNQVTMVNGTLKDLSKHCREISGKLQPKIIRFDENNENMDSKKSDETTLEFRKTEMNGHYIEGTWKKDKLHGDV